jgi:DNA-directed RNA polymerases I, II, and III subunit RPABC4
MAQRQRASSSGFVVVFSVRKAGRKRRGLILSNLISGHAPSIILWFFTHFHKSISTSATSLPYQPVQNRHPYCSDFASPPRLLLSRIISPQELYFLTAIMSSPQREAYQLPSQRESQSGTTHQQTSSYTTSYGIQAGDSSAGPQVQYICGECNHKVSLGRGDAIRCKECGHRVLYKERTKR